MSTKELNEALNEAYVKGFRAIQGLVSELSLVERHYDAVVSNSVYEQRLQAVKFANEHLKPGSDADREKYVVDSSITTLIIYYQGLFHDTQAEKVKTIVEGLAGKRFDLENRLSDIHNAIRNYLGMPQSNREYEGIQLQLALCRGLIVLAKDIESKFASFNNEMSENRRLARQGL